MKPGVSRVDQRRSNLPPALFWIILGVLSIACLLVLLTAGSLYLDRSRTPPPQPTAILEIIAASTIAANQTPGPDTYPAGSATIPPAQLGSEIDIGAYVQVAGTGGDGLRLRDHPGLNGKILLVASEAEVFKLQDGPVEMDGYSWWQLVGPFDESRQGWAVENYLELVQNP